MALYSQFRTFFVSPFGEPSVTDELNAFLRGNRIINVEKKLIDGERGTGWLFLVEHGQEQKGSGQYGPKVDWREVLDNEQFALFERLRALRKSAAERHGVPVYAVFTNEHLAGMARSLPRSVKDLKAIPGIGASRIKQFGEEFLAAINPQPQQEQDETPGPTL